MTRSEKALLRSALERTIFAESCELQRRKDYRKPTKATSARLAKLRRLFQQMGGTKTWWESLEGKP
jgi:hypothetical protein